MKWLPNALSITRAVLGVLVIPVLVWFDLWEWAFWTMVFAAITDFADGGAAILMHCESKWGKEVLDPRCDALLVLGVILGWVIQADHFTRFICLALIYLGGESLYRIKRGQRSTVQRIATPLLPIGIFVTLYIFGYYYAHTAYGDAMRRPWWTASLLIIPAVLMKIHRFKSWVSGQL